MTWAQRLKCVFNIDIETCGGCGGQIKIIACMEAPLVIEKILTHLERKDTTATERSLPPRGRYCAVMGAPGSIALH